MLRKIKLFLKKYQSFLIYFLVGLIVTFANILSYSIYRLINNNYLLNVVLAWITSLIVAFLLNKILVFKTKKVNILKEFKNFTLVRLITLGVEVFLMYLLVDLLNIHDLISKLLVTTIIFLLNYFCSKIFVFKNHS